MAFALSDSYRRYFIDVELGKYTQARARAPGGAEAIEVVAGQTLQHDVSLTPREGWARFVMRQAVRVHPIPLALAQRYCVTHKLRRRP